MGDQVPARQLQQLLDAVVGMRQQAKAQNVSTTLWAVATMGQQVPAQQLQQLLDAVVDMRHNAKPQEVQHLVGVCKAAVPPPAAVDSTRCGGASARRQCSGPGHVAS
jgi:hypothetical protein